MSTSNQYPDQQFYPNNSGQLPLATSAEQATTSEQTPDYMQHMTLVLVILHLSVFVSGLVGNSLVCLSVYRNKSLQTVTNYYIVNLAVADFLVILICLPPTVYWDLSLTWNFGLIPCKLVLYLQTISVGVSVLTLTCISIDRWYAICRPLEFCSTKSRAKVTILLIWLLSMLIASPDAIFLTTKPIYEEDGHVYMDCTHSWPEINTSIYQVCIVTLLFVFPFVLMSISYWHIVNVLWRNETMAESCQNSFQQQSKRIHRQLSTKLTVASIGEQSALNNSELEADQVKSAAQINQVTGSSASTSAVPAQPTPQASLGATAVVVCLLMVDDEQRQPQLAGGDQGDCMVPARAAIADTTSSASLCDNSCVNNRVRHQEESTHPHLDPQCDQFHEAIHEPRPPVNCGSLIENNGRSKPDKAAKSSSLCGSDCLVGLMSRNGDKFMAQKTSRRYRKNLANYATRKAKFMNTSQGSRAPISAPSTDPGPAEYRHASISDRPAEAPSQAENGVIGSGDQAPSSDKRASPTYRQPPAETSLSEPDNSGPPSPEVAGTGRALARARNLAHTAAHNSVSCSWKEHPSASRRAVGSIGSQSRVVGSPSGAANPSINNNSTRFCKLIESRKKAAKMLIVIVIMFGLCYLPVHFLNILRCTVGLPQNHITTLASLVTHWLCYFNSAINPLIYNLMSGKFRHEFANLFFCKCFRR